MARFLAIDWDENECRCAVAAIQDGKVAISDVGIIPIDDEEFDSPLTALSIALHSYCKEEKIRSCPLLISLGRNEVEWLQQKLPPCKITEIPLLLQNQVLREIPGSTEADPLDYLILDTTSEGHRVLALTITQTFQKSLTRTFRSLGFPPLRIGFRAGNAAELILQNPEMIGGEHAKPCLVVNTVGNDVDLIIIADNRIAAARSFRLPAEHQLKNLADEIERTLTIGLEGSDLLPVQHIVLFNDETKTELPKYLSKNDLTIQFLNPFTLPRVSTAKSINEPEKFAPLVGSLLIQSMKIKPVIDFLHPKEAPNPPDYTRPALLAFALLGILCFGLYCWNLSVIDSMEKKLAKVKETHKQVAAEIEQLTPSYNVLSRTWQWESQNVVWLDVLENLSRVLPSDRDLVVSQMTLTTGPINNNPRYAGSISLLGMVRDPSVLMKLQNDLHSSELYRMQYQTPRQNPAGGGYPWLFTTTIYRLR